tara:strand:- start:606 stop:1046 length:441 start_codon:yes stop_codon:yes gene_type:complete
MFVVTDIFHVVYVYVKFVYMRVLILLVALVLVGCAKPPTYLECTRGNLDKLGYVWLVIDHENDLFMTAFQSKKNPEDFVVEYGRLNTQDTKYRFFDLEEERTTWTLDRQTLKFYALNSSIRAYNCSSAYDLSEIRAKGLEQARIKI